MTLLNENYTHLKDSYLFSQVAQKVNEFAKAHPEKKIIKLGIGDVTLPLAPAVVKAMGKGCSGDGRKEHL
jgi:LL-diaminopimelate aminotransferase